MKMFQAECGDCGVFSLEEKAPKEILYVKYSKMPIARVECPSCDTETLSKIDNLSADLYRSLGMKVRNWETELTEEKIETFMENFQSEISTLLS